jgi:hypothetical protein
MDIALETIDVWRFDGDIAPLDFLRAARCLLSENDIALFGAYEPTPVLIAALASIGAISHAHLPEFFTCFDLNRSNYPHGCAFEYHIESPPFSDILALDQCILEQQDIPSFYDHFIAFRPGRPQIPLISFHDAVCGGTLYISGLYSEEDAEKLASELNVSYLRMENPALDR